MAYDKILSCHARLDRLIQYVCNPQKTTMPGTGLILAEALNCDLETAYQDMKKTKRRWGKQDGMAQPAYYDNAALKLYINPDTPDSTAFAAIATEIALCRFHAKGAYDYDRAENLLDAQSISYVMCKRFGIPMEKPDLSNLGALYQGYTPDDRWHALSRIQEMGKKISGAIENGIAPQQRSRANNIQRRNQRPPVRSAAR